MEASTLSEIFLTKSTIKDKGITFVKSGDEESFLSYNHLYIKAQKALAFLQSKGIRPGNELLFQIDENDVFITIFWACILGGIIPVPVSVGSNDEFKLKVFKIWGILNRPYLIANQAILSKLTDFSIEKNLDEKMSVISKNALLLEEMNDNDGDEVGLSHQADISDIAFIQFSSGSTGDPKGVVLTHKNLLTNTAAMIKRTCIKNEDTCLSWMPLTHDMGLIAFHITALIVGASQVIMPTALFIRRPALWMEKAHEHKATMLYSPNFGYKYFLNYHNSQEEKDWDFSYVRLILNGAEPISVELCDLFLEEMSRFGLSKNAMYPCYGLAEGTIGVSSPEVGEAVVSVSVNRHSLGVGCDIEDVDQKDRNAVTFVEVGYPLECCKVRICDDSHSVLKDNAVGHIQIKGPSVTGGYYNNVSETQKVISSDGWLDTGDLGFLRNERLVITGRAKDIIFINGHNYYPHDIERICETVKGVELGKVLACGVLDKSSYREQIIVFVVFKKKLDQFMEVIRDIKITVSKQTGIGVYEVIPVNKIPKTTSGKFERYKLAKMYEEGQFEPLILQIRELMREQNKVKV